MTEGFEPDTDAYRLILKTRQHRNGLPSALRFNQAMCSILKRLSNRRRGLATPRCPFGSLRTFPILDRNDHRN